METMEILKPEERVCPSGFRILALVLCLRDKDIASTHFLAIEFCDGALGLFWRRHFDESESSAATRFAIGYDASGDYGADGFEERLKVFIRGGKGEASNEQLVRHRSIPYELYENVAVTFGASGQVRT